MVMKQNPRKRIGYFLRPYNCARSTELVVGIINCSSKASLLQFTSRANQTPNGSRSSRLIMINCNGMHDIHSIGCFAPEGPSVAACAISSAEQADTLASKSGRKGSDIDQPRGCQAKTPKHKRQALEAVVTCENISPESGCGSWGRRARVL